jgi:AraC-like DNA-binding protein
MLVFEMQSPSQGSAVMIARILDLIFIQILRTWAAGTDAEPNWLAGALDPQIGLALSAIHRKPGRDWTAEELARACNLSRSAFAARFVARVGKPPATYLAHVRLDAATDLLRSTSLPVTLATEAVRTLIAWLGQQSVPTVIAHTRPRHQPSPAVAAAAGLTSTGQP